MGDLKKAIICGGRTYNNYAYLKYQLDQFQYKEIISGNAPGADRLGEKYARERNIPLIVMPANWGKYGSSAGPIRNQAMLDLDPDIVIAFPGGSGTTHMIKIAKAKGIEVWEP